MKKPSREESVALVLGLGPKKSEEPPEEEDSMESEFDSKDAAARAVFDAVKADDFESFKGALSSYVYLCAER